jgi:hypothetical protein
MQLHDPTIQFTEPDEGLNVADSISSIAGAPCRGAFGKGLRALLHKIIEAG